MNDSTYSLPSPSRDSWRVSAAERRRACAVALDLRVAGRAGAVAVDRKGKVVAWALVFGDGDHGELSKLAIEELSVTPRALRVLLGSEAAQVGVFVGVDAPETVQIIETMLAEGYEPHDKPAVAAMATASGTWLVAEYDEDRLIPLAEGFSGLLEIEPEFVIDQLVLAKSIDAGSATVERGDSGLSIVAMPLDAAPFVRSLPAGVDAATGAREAQRTLAAAGVEGNVRVLGSKAAELFQSLDESGFEVVATSLPTRGEDTMPASLELAWRLAEGRRAPCLGGPRLDRRGQSVLWARRASWAAIVLGLLGFALFAFGLTSWLTAQKRLRVLEAEAAGMAAQIQQLRQSAVLFEEVQELRGERVEQTLPWPRLAQTVGGLARERPWRVGWESLAITDGALELRVSAAGPAPHHELELMRRTLESAPDIVNVAWETLEEDTPSTGLHRTFRAKVRTSPATGGEVAP